MPIDRIFLDWSQAFLPEIAERLVLDRLHDKDNSSFLDLRNKILILPTKSAERRLIEILVAKAEAADKILLPPKRCSIAALPELFYLPSRTLATAAQKRLAWVTALSRISNEHSQKLFLQKSDQINPAERFSIASTLDRLWSSDLGPALTHFADVPDRSQGLLPESEQDRWFAMQAVYQQFIEVLKGLELSDPDTERSLALPNELREIEDEIVLVGTADLKIVAKTFLNATTARVSSYINAPESLSSFFDEVGCLLPSKWAEREIDIPDESIYFVETPLAQGELLTQLLADGSQTTRLEDIAIGTADESLTDSFQASFNTIGLNIRSGAGKPLVETQVCSLLGVILYFEESRSMKDLGTALRHPDIQRYLYSKMEDPSAGQYMIAFDRYHRNHLQERFDDKLAEQEQSYPELHSIHTALTDLTPNCAGQSKAIEFWVDYTLELLIKIYEIQLSERDKAIREEIEAACITCRNLLEELRVLSSESEKLTAVRFSDLFLSLLADKNVPHPVEHNTINASGWLELQLSDASACFITSMNEGVVPAIMNEDPFLPNALRSTLGLSDNTHRFGRDLYFLEALSNNVPTLGLIASTRNSSGEPTMASRLLLSIPKERLAKRVQDFYSADNTGSSLGSDNDNGNNATPTRVVFPLALREPADLESPITTMNVTSFKDYLNCPYRFYLRHVLRLSDTDDLSLEMDPATFGTLTHDVLADFAVVSNKKKLKSLNDIQGAVEKCFQKRVAQRFGRDGMLPAVKLQLRLLKARLEKFSEWQAARTADGWEIMHTELEFNPERFSISLSDGSTMGLSGRVDRIDYSRKENRWEIFDYKTVDNPKYCNPEVTHRIDDEWSDVQLPLYRYLLRESGVQGQISTGYVSLSQEVEKIGAYIADWDSDSYQEAEKCAAEVALAVRKNVFWPPTEIDPERDAFSEICSGYLNQWK